MANRIRDIYQALFDRFGPQHWWPGDTPFEVMVGAVLTQNTSWRNVSTAIDALRQRGLLSFEAMEAMPVEVLAELIRSSGYYNQKAKRLLGLLAAIRRESGDLDSFLALPLSDLREKLLAISGIGPETADSIILYAAGQPAFVVDAYTHRVLSRHGLVPEETTYHEIQDLFLSQLPLDASLFNEYHALLVRVGKEYCRKAAPLCDDCPLAGL
ncbi:MAG: endonuclease III domain-containing protein [Thermodesulfobacteriota bacterium]